MTTSPTSGRSRSITREECLVPTTFTDGLWHDDHAKVLLCAPVHDAELRGAGFEVLRDRDPLRKGWSTVVFDRHDVNEANAARGIKSDSKLSKTELLEMMAILARAVGRAGVRRP